MKRNVVIANLIDWWIANCGQVSDRIAAMELNVDLELLQSFLLGEKELSEMPEHFENTVKELVLPDVKESVRIILNAIDRYYEGM